MTETSVPGTMSIMDLNEQLSYACPRCQNEVSERFYGPCYTCRTLLRSTYASEGRVIEFAEYVPKMNVTPNAVAVKDD